MYNHTEPYKYILHPIQKKILGIQKICLDMRFLKLNWFFHIIIILKKSSLIKSHQATFRTPNYS